MSKCVCAYVYNVCRKNKSQTHYGAKNKQIEIKWIERDVMTGRTLRFTERRKQQTPKQNKQRAYKIWNEIRFIFNKISYMCNFFFYITN